MNADSTEVANSELPQTPCQNLKRYKYRTDLIIILTDFTQLDLLKACK